MEVSLYKFQNYFADMMDWLKDKKERLSLNYDKFKESDYERLSSKCREKIRDCRIIIRRIDVVLEKYHDIDEKDIPELKELHEHMQGVYRGIEKFKIELKKEE